MVVVAGRIVSNAAVALLPLVLLVLLFLLTACGGMETASGRSMGTSYAVEARCAGAIPAEAIAAVLAEVNRQMSTYDADSELSAFNRLPVGESMPVSAGLAEVAAIAERVATQTEGAFDATVAPLVALWGFGAGAVPRAPTDAERQSPTAAQRQAPTAAQMQSALANVGFRRVNISVKPPTLRKLAAVTLDLSAIAKGYAVDRIAALLDRSGCSAYLVELGGEVRVRGRNARGKPWRIGIESPGADGLAGWLSLLDGAVATSGDYRQSRPQSGIEGGRISHIIDPRTGLPIRHKLASVTIVADTAALADAYATALLVLGENAGLAFAERHDLAAVFIRRAETGYAVEQSTAMAAYRTPSLP